VFKFRPLEGPGIKINEMPDGMQIVRANGAVGEEICYVTRVVEGELQLWTGRVSVSLIARADEDA
jgi:hypothetical protein